MTYATPALTPDPPATPLVLVLTPFLGGPYFGAIIEGMRRALEAAGMPFVVAQTYNLKQIEQQVGVYLGDPGAGPQSRLEDASMTVSASRLPLGWNRATGIMTIVEALP